MKHGLKRTILFSLLGLSYGLLSYGFFGQWWNSSLGSLLIIFISYLIWKKDFLKKIGLHLDLRTVAKTFLLAILVIAGSFLIMKYIADKNKILIALRDWRSYYHDIFYILNEEIVIGALLLYASVNKWKIHPIVASIGLAIVFSLMHFVFYKWTMIEKGIIGFTTLLTLFLVGFVRNNLILQTGHIGYSWALHFGWMVVMFGCLHVDLSTNLIVTEPVKFNTYLGSIEMLIVAMIIAGLSLGYWIKKYSPHHASLGIHLTK
jgi:hypothetical protein